MANPFQSGTANTYASGGIANNGTGNSQFNTIDHAFVNQYTNNVYMALADKGYKFKDLVMHDTTIGERAVTVEVIGSTSAEEHTERHGKTPEPANIAHGKRWVTTKTYDTVEWIDDEDKVKTLIDPTNPYAMRQAQAIGRKMDIEIHRALTGSSLITANSADGGPDDRSTIALPSSQKILLPDGVDGVGGDIGSDDDGGLTVQKLLQAKQKLMESDNDLDMEDQLCLIVAPVHLTQLLNTTQATSSDYAAIKALAHGEIKEFAGFKFVWWNSLPRYNRVNGVQTGAAVPRGTAVTNAHSQNLVAFVKSGVQMNTWKQVRTQMDKRTDFRNTLQLFTTATFGASRIDEEKVVEIECLSRDVGTEA